MTDFMWGIRKRNVLMLTFFCMKNGGDDNAILLRKQILI